MTQPVILTGLRTNAEYHLGNYLGAILPMVNMQKQHLGEYQINMFAPDLHSFTTPIDHTALYRMTIHNLKVFAASGMPLENPDFYLYRQSYISAHSELTWILDCFTHFGEASRMIEFKDKSSRFGSETVSMGQFNYPVLMAADILLYGATYVPLGDDQKQHLELARDLGIRLNNKFGDLFILPEPWKKQLTFTGRLEGARIRSLKNPDKKMSKSVVDRSGTILLSDTPSVATKKIKSAETDSVGVINWNWATQPGITNLLQIYELLSAKEHKDVLSEWTGRDRYGDLKSAVAEVVSNFLQDFQTKLANISDSELLSKLELSETAMNLQANKTLLKVQKAVGLRA